MRRIRVLLLFPVMQWLGVPAIVLVVILPAGGWIAIGAAAALAVLFLTGLRLSARADGDGIHVTNRFLHHNVPWDQVWFIEVQDRMSAPRGLPAIVLRRKGSLWSSIRIYSTLGLDLEGRRQAALRLAELGSRAGVTIPVGTENEPLNPAAEAFEFPVP